MIQIAATSRTTLIAPPAPAPGGDAAAFGLSLDAMLDAPGQPIAVPGKPLPPAPVSAAPSGLDTGVEPVVLMAATIAPVETKMTEAPASATDGPVAVVAARPDTGAAAAHLPMSLTSDRPRAAEPARRTPVACAPDGPDAIAPQRPTDCVQPPRSIEPHEQPAVDGEPKPVDVSSPALAAKTSDILMQPTDRPHSQVATPPPHSPHRARSATVVAPDLPTKTASDEDTPETPAGPAPAALPVPIPASVSPEAMLAMPIAAPLRASADAPVSTGSPPTVVAPQRTGTNPAVSVRPAAAGRLTVESPGHADTALAPPNTPFAPTAALSPDAQQPTGERPRAIADRQTFAQPIDTMVLSADDALPQDAMRTRAVASLPENGDQRYEAVAALRSAATASAPFRNGADVAADSAAPALYRPLDGGSAVDASRARQAVEPSPAVRALSPTPVVYASPPTTGVAPPFLPGADIPANVDPDPPRGGAGAASALPLTAIARDVAVAPTIDRTDPVPSPVPGPVSANPVSPPPAAPVANPPSTTEQVAAMPLATTPTRDKRPEDASRAGGLPTRTAPPVTLVSPFRAQAPLIAAGTTAPAFRLFAEAIHAARRDERSGDPLAPAPVATIDPPRAALPVGGATLDMTDRGWPHAMIDRIEALRDAASAGADAADTSIRLVPAALGAIDVSVRRDGDAVHVHFNAEQAATRALLTEAQPRLAELAESRGIKLGQTSVGAGADQNAQRQPTPPPARIPAAPAPAARDDEPDIATIRVA